MDRRAFLTTAGRSLIVSTAVVQSASAADDSALRELVRAAGLTPYWTFKAIKDFSYLEVHSSRPVSVRELAGKVLLVNLWATWCSPCVREMQSLEGLHQQFNSHGLIVLGINIYDRADLRVIANWLDRRNLTFLNLKGDRDGPPLVSNLFIPQTFVIDRQRRLIANKTGEHEWTSRGVQELVRHMLDAG